MAKDQTPSREEVIAWARESGLHLPYWADDEDPEKDPPRWTTVSPLPPLLERFAALVAAAEREACARVCDEKVDAEYATGKVDHNEMGWTQACATAILARGQA